MPLKLKRRGDIYYIRGTVAGAHVYETTGTSDRKAAEGYRQKRESDLYERRIHGERSVVGFEEATLSYMENQMPGGNDRKYIARLVNALRGKRLIDMNQATVDGLFASVLSANARPATRIRSVLTPLNAILNHASRRGWCDRPNFERPSMPKGKTRWLTPAEALGLIDSAAPHLKPLLIFLFCTGARLSEALELDWRDVDLSARRVTFWNTKAGNATDEDRPRHATLPSASIDALTALSHREGTVFLRPIPLPTLEKGNPRFAMFPYTDREREQGGQIKTAFKGACRRAGLGQMVLPQKKGKSKFVTDVTPHVLRHTWATYFYALTKDLLLLRNEGGWSKVSMVERYAHLMKSDLVPEIASVWGDSHPLIGQLRAQSVQAAQVA